MDEYEKNLLEGAHPLSNPESIAHLVDAMKDKKIVMIGEATHGTKEFYKWRQLITQELITRHGFNFVAVEGDWPPCQRIHQFINGKEAVSAHEILKVFNRWPTWMWSNNEMQRFIAWAKEWNETAETKVGFHGLDVYSFFESIEQVITILKKVDSKLALEVQKKYGCFESYEHNEIAYAESLLAAPAGCKKEILEVLHATLRTRLNGTDKDAWLDARQNAQIVKSAEEYYRAMIFGEDDSWNVRDNHMMTTLEMLLENYGTDAKAIVWEHNTHIGDYRATDMVAHGQINIGGLAREIYGAENVGLVGFGTYSGSVTASFAWDGPTKVFDLPEARKGSVEHACHSIIKDLGAPDFYLLFNPSEHGSVLNEIRGHRAIGVVYEPDIEHRGTMFQRRLLTAMMRLFF